MHVVAFARVREVIGSGSRQLQLPAGAGTGELWNALVREYPALESLRESTRTAQNGRVIEGDCELHDGDEIALLPPVGGG